MFNGHGEHQVVVQMLIRRRRPLGRQPHRSPFILTPFRNLRFDPLPSRFLVTASDVLEDMIHLLQRLAFGLQRIFYQSLPCTERCQAPYLGNKHPSPQQTQQAESCKEDIPSLGRTLSAIGRCSLHMCHLRSISRALNKWWCDEPNHKVGSPIRTRGDRDPLGSETARKDLRW